MDEQEFAQLLMETFLQELSEHIETLSHELLAVEKAQSPEELDELWKVIFRAAHTLKGASAAVNVLPIQNACHHLEDIFGHFRDQRIAAPESMISLMLKVIDAIEEISVRLRAEESLEDSSLVQMLPELHRVAEELTGSEPSEPIAESPANSSVDSEKTADTALGANAMETNAKSASEFLNVLDDHVSSLSSNALALESAKSDDDKQVALTQLLQEACSLKDSAAASKLDVVRDVCERLETLFTHMQNGVGDVSAECVSRILEAGNSLADVGRRLRDGNDLKAASIQKMSEKLSKFITKPASPPKSASTDTLVEDSSQDIEPVVTAKSEQAVEVATATTTASPTAATSNTLSSKPQRGSRPAPAKTIDAGKRIATGDQNASIRVPAQKLDALLAYSGELLVVRGRFSLRAKDASELRDLATELKTRWLHSQRMMRQSTSSRGSTPSQTILSGQAESWMAETAQSFTTLTKKIEEFSTHIEADNRLLGQTCSQLDDEVYHVRMLPFTDACGGLERAVRDIATATNKKVEFKIEGGDVEVDRSVLEGLKDPLLHLVRNSVDHGIEKTGARIAAGKPEIASLVVSASLRGGQVEVVVQDDGAGFDLERICAIAKKRGLEIPEDRREQARLVFVPGFSTAKMITDISGRGVGLDVVQSRVESLHGAVDVTFREGQWTRFTLTVPLTLTTIRSLLVRVNEDVYAIPTTAVQRLVRFGINDVRSSMGRDTLRLRDSPMPVVSLAATLGLKSKGLIAGKSSMGLAVVLAAGEQRVAVAVDEVLSEQEVLVKNLGARIRRLRHFSGCTLLPSGRIAMVMNASNVVRTALGIAPTYTHPTPNKHDSATRKHLLLADDSVTTRELLKNILETAGYDVFAAADGEQAWVAAQEHHFDAVVSDVDMPRVDGFELTSKLRSNAPTAEIPIVLVTARGSDNDKERGVQVGANGYIVKGSFDQANLLDTLAQLV